ncbi:MAG: ABC transporter ATP-binding protein [Bacillota bacterium]|jgi:energy-coupling factor transport system ATP-binding protein
MTISIKSLSYYYPSYPPAKGLERINLQIGTGELVGVVGPSGAGKSSLLLCLAGILTPTDGQARITVPAGEARIGLIMQEPERQFFLNNVYEEVAFALTLRKRPKTEIDPAVRQVLEQVGYTGAWNSSPFRLSGGEQRRVAIASILIMDPDVILLDEPTVGMDAQGLAVLRALIAQWRAKQVTVLIVSHDQDFLYQEVDRVLLLKDGQLQADFAKRDWLKQTDQLTVCGVGLPEVVQLLKLPDLPESLRRFLAGTETEVIPYT